MKIKYSLYAKLEIITFKRRESKNIIISNIKNKEYINDIVHQNLFLFSIYNEVLDDFSKLYNIMAKKEKIFNHFIQKFVLKEEVLELFVFEYGRESCIKPIVIKKFEKEKYKFEERPTMRYFKDGP